MPFRKVALAEICSLSGNVYSIIENVSALHWQAVRDTQCTLVTWYIETIIYMLSLFPHSEYPSNLLIQLFLMLFHFVFPSTWSMLSLQTSELGTETNVSKYWVWKTHCIKACRVLQVSLGSHLLDASLTAKSCYIFLWKTIPKMPFSLCFVHRTFVSLIPESFWIMWSACVWPNFDPFLS